MTEINSSFPVGSVYSHNGPVCSICGQGYIGTHTCKVSVLKDKIAALEKIIEQIENQPPTMIRYPQPETWQPTRPYGFDPSKCGCNPANGGSGVCGCVLGSWTIT